MKKQPIKDDKIQISELFLRQQEMKKEIDFDKAESEMTTEELARKAVYNALDDIIEKHLGTEKKQELENTLEHFNKVKHAKDCTEKIVHIGQEIQRNFILQQLYLVNHFDKSPDNYYRTLINTISEKMINPDEDLSKEDRLKLAREILNITKVYRDKVVTEVATKQAIIEALLPTFETTLEKSQLDEVDDRDLSKYKEIAQEWLRLSKIKCKGREKALLGLKESLEIEDILPTAVIENEGGIDGTVSNTGPDGMFKRGERMIKWVNEADEIEEEFGASHADLADQLFGNLDTYLDVPKSDTEHLTKPSTPTGISPKLVAALILIIVAITVDIETAIGLFILGWILVALIQKS